MSRLAVDLLAAAASLSIRKTTNATAIWMRMAFSLVPLDLAQALGTRELAVHQSDELALGRHAPHAPVRPVLFNKPIERAPGHELQKLVEQVIVVPHGADPIPCSMQPASSRITVESAPCTASRKTEPDSRGARPRMTSDPGHRAIDKKGARTSIAAVLPRVSAPISPVSGGASPL